MAKRKAIPCRECGSTADTQYAPLPNTIPGASHAGRWICADCLYPEEHPDGAKREVPRKPKVPQSETLFGGGS